LDILEQKHLKIQNAKEIIFDFVTVRIRLVY